MSVTSPPTVDSSSFLKIGQHVYKVAQDAGGAPSLSKVCVSWKLLNKKGKEENFDVFPLSKECQDPLRVAFGPIMDTGAGLSTGGRYSIRSYEQRRRL